jgi:putative FmdB family regulatory protein
MPVYEYGCAKCGTFEVTQRITDKPLRRCPTCKGKVQKLISSTSFQLKGSGWYVTDYAPKGGAPKEAADKDAGKKGEEKTEKSETTSAPAPEAKSTTPKSEPKPKTGGKTEATAA